MGSDMVVALKEASANGTTLFGLNHHAPPTRRHAIVIGAGQIHHDAGETVSIGNLCLPFFQKCEACRGDAASDKAVTDPERQSRKAMEQMGKHHAGQQSSRCRQPASRRQIAGGI